MKIILIIISVVLSSMAIADTYTVNVDSFSGKLTLTTSYQIIGTFKVSDKTAGKTHDLTFKINGISPQYSYTRSDLCQWVSIADFTTLNWDSLSYPAPTTDYSINIQITNSGGNTITQTITNQYTSALKYVGAVWQRTRAEMPFNQGYYLTKYITLTNAAENDYENLTGVISGSPNPNLYPIKPSYTPTFVTLPVISEPLVAGIYTVSVRGISNIDSVTMIMSATALIESSLYIDNSTTGASDEDVEALQITIDNLQNLVKNLLDTYDTSALEQAIRDLETQLNTLRTESETADANLQAAINALRAESETADANLQAKIDALETAYKAADAELRASIAALATIVSNLDTELRTMIANLQSQINTVNEATTDLQNQVDNLTKQLATDVANLKELIRDTVSASKSGLSSSSSSSSEIPSVKETPIPEDMRDLRTSTTTTLQLTVD